MDEDRCSVHRLAPLHLAHGDPESLGDLVTGDLRVEHPTDDHPRLLFRVRDRGSCLVTDLLDARLGVLVDSVDGVSCDEVFGGELFELFLPATELRRPFHGPLTRGLARGGLLP